MNHDPNQKGNTMKKIIMALALVAGAATIGAPAYGAHEDGGGGHEEEEICYEQVPVQEFLYSKTVTTPNSHVEYSWDVQTREAIIEHEYQKHVDGYYEEWFFVWFKTDDTFTNVPWDAFQWQPDGYTEEGAHNAIFDQADGVRKHSTWYRYLPTGETRPGGYTDWVTTESVTGSLTPAPDDTDTTQHINKAEQTVEDEPTVTVLYYNDGAVSEVNEEIWTTDQTLDRSWKIIGERTVFVDGEEIPCPPPEEEEHPAPEPAVVTGAWVDGEWECDDTTVVQTRTIVTTPFIRETGQGKPRWIPDTANATIVTETQTRDLTDDEFEACPVPTTVTPTTVTPTTVTPVVNTPATVTPPLPPAPAAPTPVAVAPPAPQSLPSTGTETTVMAIIATLMTALGGAAIYAARRKPALG